MTKKNAETPAECEKCKTSEAQNEQMQNGITELKLRLEASNQELQEINAEGLNKRLGLRFSGNAAASRLSGLKVELDAMTAERDRLKDQLFKIGAPKAEES